VLQSEHIDAWGFALPPAAPVGYTFCVALGAPMKDMQAHLEKLRTDAEECALISKLATDKQKSELFARLSEHLNTLALEVERATAEKVAGGNA
jgi:hypothetical protein